MGDRWPSYLGVAAILAVAALVCVAVVTFLDVAETLPREVWTALQRGEAQHDRSFVFNDERGLHAVADISRGEGAALLAFLFGGVPAAIVATIVATETRISRRAWSRAWSNVFLAGLVFQVSSLALTSLVLVLFVRFGSAREPFDYRFGLLVLSASCSFWGLRSWRFLQQSVEHP